MTVLFRVFDKDWHSTNFPPDLAEAYNVAKRAKIIWVIGSFVIFLIFGMLLASYLMGMVSWTGGGHLEYPVLIITCLSVLSIVLSLSWDLPSAYLFYGCIMTDGFAERIALSEQTLLRMVELNEGFVTLMKHKEQQEIFREIDTAEKLLNLIDDLEEAEDPREAITLIRKSLPLYGFEIKVIR